MYLVASNIWEANTNQVLTNQFIRHSRTLSYVGVEELRKIDQNLVDILDLASWNRKREKLTAARKVTVYVDE